MMGWLQTLADRDESAGALGRHGALLASLTFLLVGLPLAQSISGATPSFRLLLSLVLVAAVVVNSKQRWIFRFAAVVGFGAITATLLAATIDVAATRVVADVLGLGLLGFTTLVMLNSLIQTDRVSQDTVVGGICVYLLMGLCFAMIFIVLCELDPAAFQFEPARAQATVDIEPSAVVASRLLYFSFVTLTTLGYGDIAPASDLAQMLSVAEALTGQLYLTIFLARLVALFVRESTRA